MAASQKSDFNKKDMNFFSEFTTSGSQLVSSFAIVLLALALLLVFMLGSFLFMKIKMDNVQKKIDAINTEINDPKTKASLDLYSQLKVSVEEYRSYMYVLKNLEVRQGEYLHDDTAMMDRIKANIPTAVTITSLKYEEGQVVISGNSINPSDALDMAQMLQEMNTFYFVSIDNIESIDSDAVTDLTPEEIALLKRYVFTITGSLEPSYTVTVTRILDDVTQSPLDIPSTQSLAAGEVFTVAGINSFTYDGQEYSLSRILINGNKPSANDYQGFVDSNELSERAMTKMDVKLYYVAQAAPAAEEEGDSK
jgi:Tfp pilus assembly protein PilN